MSGHSPDHTQPKITGLELSKWAQFLDYVFIPIMYLLQGNFREIPQQTHWWNNRRLTAVEKQSLCHELMIGFPGEPSTKNRWWFKVMPIFHMPIFGGWRRFVVLRPQLALGEKWFVGWLPDDESGGVSLVPLTSEVRVLLGPHRVKFFGISRDGQQVLISHCNGGLIGRADPALAKLPLR